MAYGAATLFVAGNRRVISYRQSLQLHFLFFSIADLGSRGRTRCDSSPSCRARSSHPGGEPVFLHWRPPVQNLYQESRLISPPRTSDLFFA
ncbi:hypothetical protein HanXRQr2_Chr13g0579061 [Helianthus annuus]|uniref:Uncharacterized protein n=1 Tax=Helianthus annuus TaxID=4232 RepID=A0A9K3HA58_HELAN|nr:hypothetical protein HanXRQr2_Chr13g0579061 [Helianthus annuus]